MKTIQNSKIDLSSILLNASFLLFSTLIITIITIIGASPAHAESTSSSAKASVNVSDAIRLTLTGGDLVINNLTPGTLADSNIITATVTSNSPYGFHLSATTGTNNGTTSLVNTADSNFSFTNLNANKATLNDFSDNTWGYSYSTDNGTSWVSGDYGTTQSGYNGLSLDNDDSGATGTTLFNSDTYTNSTAVKFKIGAKSATTQAAGTYTGTVNFYAVANGASARCDNIHLCITYDGNGLLFDDATTNNVLYDASTNFRKESRTEYSYVNYKEDGSYDKYGPRGGNSVVTIPNASKLHIKVTYGVPQNTGGPSSDLYIWSGNYPEYNDSNNDTSLTSCGSTNATDGAFKSDGQPGSQVTMECDIDGDSVTFYDSGPYSDTTGYYAVVTGEANIVDSYSKERISGRYLQPSYTNDSFMLLGWSEDKNATEPQYYDEEDIASKLPYVNNDKAVTLYAIWVHTFDELFAQAGKQKQNGHYKIQDMTPEICNEATVRTIGEVIDNRDNTVYRIGKMNDNRCWLLDNLALDLTNATTLNNLNENNTNATNTSLQYLKGVVLRNPETDPDGRYAIAPASDWSILSDVTGRKTYYSTPLLEISSKDIIPISDKEYVTEPLENEARKGQWKVGVYYNYCATTAGNYCFGGKGAEFHSGDGVSNEDICPNGWRLPSGDSGEEYELLYQSYDSNYSAFRKALRLPLSGFFDTTTLLTREHGENAYLISSSPHNAEDWLKGEMVNYVEEVKITNLYRTYGYSVRCILKQ